MSSVARGSCFLLLYVTSAFAGWPQTVKPGEDVTLQCGAPRDSPITALVWIKPDLRSDDYVFFYRNDRSYERYQHPSYFGRVELKDPEMKDGDVSVVLKNVTINDTGTYECHVGSGGTRELITNLTLTVEPGHTAAKGAEEGKKGGEDKSGGSKDVSVELAVGLSVAALLLVVCIGFVVKMKKPQKQSLYQPPERAADQQQV